MVGALMRDRKWLLTACLIICATYLAVGLWPFEFFPDNRARISPDGLGLSFRPLSIAHAAEPIDLSHGAGFTIELCLEGKSERKVSSILSLYDGRLPEGLLVGQWNTSLLMRTRVDGAPGGPGYRETGIEAGLRPGVRRRIAITSGPAGTVYYLDGKPVRRYPTVKPRPEALRGRLVLGDSAAGHSGWDGTISGLAIYDRALDAAEIARHDLLWQKRAFGEADAGAGLAALYVFQDAAPGSVPDRASGRRPLTIPATYGVLHKIVLHRLHGDSFNYKDIGMNLIGFMPLGFFLCLYLAQVRPRSPWTNALLTVLAAGMVSLSIELIQVYLPTRHSQLLDVLSNSAGSALGIIASKILQARRVVSG